MLGPDGEPKANSLVTRQHQRCRPDLVFIRGDRRDHSDNHSARRSDNVDAYRPEWHCTWSQLHRAAIETIERLKQRTRSRAAVALRWRRPACRVHHGLPTSLAPQAASDTTALSRVSGEGAREVAGSRGRATRS